MNKIKLNTKLPWIVMKLPTCPVSGMTLKQKRYQERCHRAETVHRNVIMGFMENNCLERHLLRQVIRMKELGATGFDLRSNTLIVIKKLMSHFGNLLQISFKILSVLANIGGTPFLMITSLRIG